MHCGSFLQSTVLQVWLGLYEPTPQELIFINLEQEE